MTGAESERVAPPSTSHSRPQVVPSPPLAFPPLPPAGGGGGGGGVVREGVCDAWAASGRDLPGAPLPRACFARQVGWPIAPIGRPALARLPHPNPYRMGNQKEIVTRLNG